MNNIYISLIALIGYLVSLLYLVEDGSGGLEQYKGAIKPIKPIKHHFAKSEINKQDVSDTKRPIKLCRRCDKPYLAKEGCTDCNSILNWSE